jgi:hypothetical protein
MVRAAAANSLDLALDAELHDHAVKRHGMTIALNSGAIAAVM